MQNRLLLIGCMLAASNFQAQPWTGTVPGADAYRSGNTGIGTTSPTYKLHIIEPAGTGIAKAAHIELTANNGGNYECLTGLANDNGTCTDLIGIRGIANGGGGQQLWNSRARGGGSTSASGGNFGGFFSLSSIGSSNSLNAGIYGSSSGLTGANTYAGYFVGRTHSDGWLTVANDVNVDLSIGVGIGITSVPTLGRVEVETDPAGGGISFGGHFTSHGNATSALGHTGVFGQAISSNGTEWWMVGLEGLASNEGEECNYNNWGVRGVAKGGVINVGGYFSGQGINDCCYQNIGVWGNASERCNPEDDINLAGFFSGNVHIEGNLTGPSDRKLKKEIRPIEKALDKIMALKPSTYKFKEDEEFKDLHLPHGQQFGLIAQDLEVVLPELVGDFKKIEVNHENTRINIPEHKIVQYIPLIPVLIAAMQEQQKIISEEIKTNEKLAERIRSLENSAEQSNIELYQKSISLMDSQNIGFRCSQNIPNPYSEKTAIECEIEIPFQKAHLVFYDLSGKEQLTKIITKNGKSEVLINAGELPAGIYFYSIIVDSKIADLKKMIVEK